MQEHPARTRGRNYGCAAMPITESWKPSHIPELQFQEKSSDSTFNLLLLKVELVLAVVRTRRAYSSWQRVNFWSELMHIPVHGIREASVQMIT